MTRLIKQTLFEVLQAIMPLVLGVVILQFAFVQMPTTVFLQFLGGTVMVLIGITLFLVGVRVGIMPLGETVGSELPHHASLLFVLGVAFVLGFSVTVAEPGVIVLTQQLADVNAGVGLDNALAYVIAASIGLYICMALLRIVLGISIRYILIFNYGIVLVLSFFVPGQLIPVAFDAGGVTTGPMTVPVILALGLGFSAVLAQKSTLAESFGLIGLAAIGPVIGILLVGVFA